MPDHYLFNLPMVGRLEKVSTEKHEVKITLDFGEDQKEIASTYMNDLYKGLAGEIIWIKFLDRKRRAISTIAQLNENILCTIGNPKKLKFSLDFSCRTNPEEKAKSCGEKLLLLKGNTIEMYPYFAGDVV